MTMTSGTVDTTDSTVRQRSGVHIDSKSSGSPVLQEVEDADLKTPISADPIYKTVSLGILNLLIKVEPVLVPIFFTIVALWTRIYKIGLADKVVWDEAHFGKFGSQYLKHEYYHDVHPPLGKMLVGLSGYLSGYNGSFAFDNGGSYPEWVDFKSMRCFQAVFSAGCVPVAYLTAKALGFRYYTVIFITLMVLFENSFVALGRFILLDSMLLFFTTTTFYCFAQVHRLRNEEFSACWKLWMVLSGLSIGCVCSVKWVGLFVTAVTGLYTVLDLWLKTWEFVDNYSRKTFYRDIKMYAKHWLFRVLTLIVIPAIVYLGSFKVHFALLSKSGTGSASMNTLFQANLDDSTIPTNMPRDVALGSKVTLRSHGLSPNLLHSHASTYPDGSQQNQITTYGFSDDNNNFLVHFPRGDPLGRDFMDIRDYKNLSIIHDGDVIRLQHELTGTNLHSHAIKGHVTASHWEVSGYGNLEIGDEKDNWVVEIVKQTHSSDPEYVKANESTEEYFNTLHYISTNFRLRHVSLGCYLSTTGASYPAWGFKQGEVTCRKSNSRNDRSTWWNIELNENERLPNDDAYAVPKNKFFDDFLMAQYAMMSSNNALVPDPMKFDEISSEWWEWPILNQGLRMCGWGANSIRYYLLTNPFTGLASTVSILGLIGIIVHLALLWNRQLLRLDNAEYNWYFIVCGIFPFIAWVLHYLPFIVMGRVTYFHHYMPALYFAMFVFAFVMEYLTIRANKYVKFIVYLALYTGVIGVFYLFSPLCFGMTGSLGKYKNLEWWSGWRLT